MGASLRRKGACVVRRVTRDQGGNGGRGGHWIRTEKRRRIYARDGWKCVWCQTPLAVGYLACLDHVLPRNRGGSNHESNLVTSCLPCNAERGDMSAVDFAWTRLPAYTILDRVITAMGKELPK
jgi:5-methylcytosine-specific restriction endonuclease McrA